MQSMSMSVNLYDQSSFFLLRYIVPGIRYEYLGVPCYAYFSLEGREAVEDCTILLTQSKFGIPVLTKTGATLLAERIGSIPISKINKIREIESEDPLVICRAIARARDGYSFIPKEDSLKGVLSVMELPPHERLTELIKIDRRSGFARKLLEYLTKYNDRDYMAQYHPRYREKILALVSRLDRKQFASLTYDPEYSEDFLLELGMCIRG